MVRFRDLLLAAATFGLCALHSQVPRTRQTKVLHFKTQRGDLTVEVNTGLPGKPLASSIALSAEGAEGPTTAEEVGILRQVLQQMASFGADPRELVLIHFYIQEPDVVARLAIAAAQSENWRAAIKTGRGTNSVVATLLNDLGAYNAFNDALAAYGMEVVRVGGVEDVLVKKLASLHLNNAPPGLDGTMSVPTGASAFVTVGKKKTP